MERTFRTEVGAGAEGVGASAGSQDAAGCHSQNSASAVADRGSAGIEGQGVDRLVSRQCSDCGGGVEANGVGGRRGVEVGWIGVTSEGRNAICTVGREVCTSNRGAGKDAGGGWSQCRRGSEGDLIGRRANTAGEVDRRACGRGDERSEGQDAVAADVDVVDRCAARADGEDTRAGFRRSCSVAEEIEGSAVEVDRTVTAEAGCRAGCHVVERESRLVDGKRGRGAKGGSAGQCCDAPIESGCSSEGARGTREIESTRTGVDEVASSGSRAVRNDVCQIGGAGAAEGERPCVCISTKVQRARDGQASWAADVVLERAVATNGS